MKDCLYQGRVIGEDFFRYGMKLTCSISSVICGEDTIPLPLRAEFSTYQKKVYLGKKLLIRGNIQLSDKPHRPNILNGTIISEMVDSHIGRIFYSIASFIDRHLKRNLTVTAYEVGTSFLLGGSSRVQEKVKNVFARAGVLHILSVSGLHVGFVISFFGFLFIFFPIPQRIKFILIMLILFIYAGVTGFRPSVVRAGLMAFFLGLALILQRNVDSIHILNITGIFLLISEPLMLFDIGAQLSFASVYGILYLFPRIDKILLKKIKSRFLRSILSLMAISFSAQLFVSPLLVYYFNRLQTLAVITNILIVPLSSIIIYLLFSALFFSLIFMPIAQIIFKVISLLINVLISICNFFAAPNFASVNLTIPVVFLFFFYLLFVKPLRKFVVYTILILAVFFSIASLAKCHTLKISRGGISLETAQGASLLITPCENPNPLLLIHNGETDYLVAPKKLNYYKRSFITYPEPLYYKKIKIENITIELDQDIKIVYPNGCIKYSDFQRERDGIMNIIIKGNKRYNFKSKLNDSIIDRLIADFRVSIIKIFY